MDHLPIFYAGSFWQQDPVYVAVFFFKPVCMSTKAFY